MCVTVGQCFNTNTNDKLASCGAPSFSEGNVMHQAPYFTEAGVASYTSNASFPCRQYETRLYTIPPQHSTVTVSWTVGWSGGWPGLTCRVFLACWLSGSTLTCLTRYKAPLSSPEPTLTITVTHNHFSGIGNGVLSQEVTPFPSPLTQSSRILKMTSSCNNTASSLPHCSVLVHPVMVSCPPRDVV